MKEKRTFSEFWRRTNRGFWIAVLLAAVIVVYVIVGQILLIPGKNQIKDIGTQYRAIMERYIMLTDAQRDSLSQSGALEAEEEKVKKELKEFFDPDSAYLDSAVGTILQLASNQVNTEEKITALKDTQVQRDRASIREDVGSYVGEYIYIVDGVFQQYVYDDSSGQKVQYESMENVDCYLSINLYFKQVGGDWKIFRVANSSWYYTGTRGGVIYQ